MDLMIDIETLGTTPDCAILSIGAVLFDPHTGAFGSEAYLPIGLGGIHERGIDPTTLEWWMRQAPEARDAAFLPAEPMLLEDALVEVHVIAGQAERVWAKGPHFDISILDHALEHIPPWKFWKVRDVRTLLDLHPGLSVPFEGTAHNALDDAKHQARQVIEVFKHLANHGVTFV